ncbi:hypothetical protein SAMN05444167_1073 [Terriglobus roseus]|uniref:Uncharacterized protein n=1 Tax=Terriglobus roseus TaxID=392734 RepID=A0A1G7HHQ1_9BACT|nr:hypothetical protein SAMN05444167_1073 [Terriglobus roseus]
MLAKGKPTLSKDLARELFLSPSEVSKSLQRSREAGLLHTDDRAKRVNRPALLELLLHGFKYVFPAQKGGLTRGIPTGTSVEPLSAAFPPSSELPAVWPYAYGTVRGLSLSPLYKGAPQAALLDKDLYSLLALCDAIRDGRARERNLAGSMLKEALSA